jgi:hypothetical protein
VTENLRDLPIGEFNRTEQWVDFATVRRGVLQNPHDHSGLILTGYGCVAAGAERNVKQASADHWSEIQQPLELQRFREKTRRPVVACLMDIGTGGAYYLATASDLIVAHPTTITGGIGVVIADVAEPVGAAAALRERDRLRTGNAAAVCCSIWYGRRLFFGELSLQFLDPLVLGLQRLDQGCYTDGQEETSQPEIPRPLVLLDGSAAHEQETT